MTIQKVGRPLKIELDRLVPSPVASCVPDLLPHELEDLEARIREDGITDDLHVADLGTGKYRILDGHHRWKVAKKLGLVELLCQVFDLGDYPEKAYILTRTTARRTLNPTQRGVLANDYRKVLAEYIAKQEAARKSQEAKTRTESGKKGLQPGQLTQATCPESTGSKSKKKKPAPTARAQAAKAVGASDRQTKYVQQIEESDLPSKRKEELLAAMRSGKLDGAKAVKEVKDAARKAKIADQNKEAERLRKQQAREHEEAEARVKSEEAAAKEAEKAQKKAEAQARKAQEEAERQEALAKKATEEAEKKKALEAQRKAEEAQKKAEEEAKRQEAAARKAEAEAQAAAEKAAAMERAMQRFRLIHGDCLVEMPKLDTQFDLIVADPPYFLSHGENAGLLRPKGDWDKPTAEAAAFTEKWIRLAADRLKVGGSFFVFGTMHDIYNVAGAAVRAGLELLQEIIWRKPVVQPSFGKNRWKYEHETILWFRMGEKHKFRGDPNQGDVWEMASLYGKTKQQTGHPTEKPVELIKRLVEATTDPGDTVLDPFVGSGTTMEVCIRLDRDCIGIERHTQWAGVCEKRIRSCLATGE